MKNKIKALLAEKFQGERKDALALLADFIALQCQDADEAILLVDKLKPEVMGEFVKGYRSGVDKEIAEAIKTAKSKTEAKPTSEEPSNMGNENSKDAPTPLDIEGLIQRAVQPLTDKIQAYEAEKLQSQRLHSVEQTLSSCRDELLKAKALKDYKRMSFGDEESFKEYITELEGDIKGANQRIAEGEFRGLKPTTDVSAPKPTSEVVDALIDNLNF